MFRQKKSPAHPHRGQKTFQADGARLRKGRQALAVDPSQFLWGTSPQRRMSTLSVSLRAMARCRGIEWFLWTIFRTRSACTPTGS